MATSKQYRALETAVTFCDSGGDAVLTLNNLAAGAARVSAQVDRGAGSKPADYKWRAVIQLNAAGTVGERVRIGIVESDGTLIDGNAGASDAVFVVAQSPNVKVIGIVTVPDTNAAENFIASGECTILDRYYSVVVINDTAEALKASANVSKVILTPMPPEMQ